MPSAQSLIDAIDYPPTHTYVLDGLRPTGVLAERVRIIERVAPGLFEGSRFLDIGANKGFFSLLAASRGSRVLSVETDPECAALCARLGLRVTATIPAEGEFDRVFIGNAHHYLYRDAGGWGWVKRIAAVSTDMLVVEGPLGRECADMTCIPHDLADGFTRENFCAAMDMHYDAINVESAVAYTPDRYVMHFQRKDDLIMAPMAAYSDYLRHIYSTIAPFVGRDDVVAELCCRHDRGQITKTVIPCKRVITCDRNPKRCETTVDVLRQDLPPCDVAISTAILHHTAREQWPVVLGHMTAHTRRLVCLSGPAKAFPQCHPPLGDHLSFVDPDVVDDMMPGWSRVLRKRVGLSKPYSEWLLIYERGANP